MKTVGLLAYGETGVAALESLIGRFKVIWIVVPESSNHMQNSLPVELLAKKNKIPVKRINDLKSLEKNIVEYLPDVVVISSFNLIIPSKIIKLTKFINVHHGDLPRYRGRANINWAIINGRREVGLAIHEVVQDLDSGNIYANYKVKITNNDTVKTVYEKFNKIIISDLAMVVSKVINGYEGAPQKGKPTYCCTRLPEDGYINWAESTKNIVNLIRGLTHPYPGAFTFLDQKKVYVWDYEMPKKPRLFEGRIPGRVVGIYPGLGVEVLTGDGSIILKNITINGVDKNASEIVRSVKKTFGMNMVLLYEKIMNT